LLNEAMKSAQGEYAARGKGKTFEVLKGFLQGVSAGLASYQVSPISSKPASSYRIKTSHFYGY